MIGLAILTAVSWLVALWYSKHYRRLGLNERENTIGPGYVLFMLVFLAGFIFFLGFVTGVSSPQPEDASGPKTPSPTEKFFSGSLIFFFAALLWMVIVVGLEKFFQPLMKNSSLFPVVAYAIPVIVAFLILSQIFFQNAAMNNIFMLFLPVLAVEFATRLKRSALLTLFSLLALLDVYLVWLANAPVGGGAGSGGSWYIALFKSDLMRHWPFPLGFRWGDHLIGNGDIFFMSVVVAYAYRALPFKWAILSGVTMTLPLLLIPIAMSIFPSMPKAWPYTIFIAPIGLLMTILARLFVFKSRL